MELKDWMLLLIPILFNGILIWGFQFRLKYDIERKENYRKLREQIFEEYLKEISKCIDLDNKMMTAGVNGYDCFEQNIYDLRDGIKNLFLQYKKYRAILSMNDKVANEYGELKNRYEEWVENLNDKDILLAFLLDCEELLQRIMDECLIYICGIKHHK